MSIFTMFEVFETLTLPRGSQNREVMAQIHGFETALEHSLPNPRDIDRVYFIEEEHRAHRYVCARLHQYVVDKSNLFPLFLG